MRAHAAQSSAYYKYKTNCIDVDFQVISISLACLIFMIVTILHRSCLYVSPG